MDFFHGNTEEKGKVLKGVQNQLKVQIWGLSLHRQILVCDKELADFENRVTG